MTLHRLDNRSWGFETSCFVCDEANEGGLGIPFFHDDERGLVTAELTPGAELSGAPKLAHGGVVLAVLDEAMAWAAIALAGRFAVVQETSTTFEHGVRIGRLHRVEATVDGHDDTTVPARAWVTDAGTGRRCAQARATLRVLSAVSARTAIGTVEGDDARYLGRR